MGISLAGGVVVGYYLDVIFKTSPWLTVIFLIAGIVAGGNIAIYIVKKFSKALR